MSEIDFWEALAEGGNPIAKRNLEEFKTGERRTTNEAQRTMHDARCTMHNERRTMHDARSTKHEARRTMHTEH